MTKRKLSIRKYLLALILTLAVFSGGVILGMVLENVRLADAEQITLNEKVNLQSLQLQQRYIESGLADCASLNKVLEANIAELAKKMAVIIDYDKMSVFSEKKFNLQLREYFLTEIQFLLTAQEIDNICQKDNVKIIYFYNEDENDIQGKILDYLKKLFGGKVLVFSFNSAFQQEPMINILLTSYGINQFPAVVVEDKVFQGQTSVKELMKAICEEFKEINNQIPEECQIT